MDSTVLKFYTSTKWEKLQPSEEPKEEKSLEVLPVLEEFSRPCSNGQPTLSRSVDDHDLTFSLIDD